MQETQIQSLGQEDPLEKEMATHSNILAEEIPWTEGRRASVHGVAKVRHNLVTKQQTATRVTLRWDAVQLGAGVGATQGWKRDSSVGTF